MSTPAPAPAPGTVPLVPSGATDATTVPKKAQSQSQGSMPSPTGSVSETSDYQRSTPSPRDQEDAEDWAKGDSDPGFSEEANSRTATHTANTRNHSHSNKSSSVSVSSSLRSGPRLGAGRCQPGAAKRASSLLEAALSKPTRSSSTSSAVSSASSLASSEASSEMKLRQVRVALHKMDDSSLRKRILVGGGKASEASAASPKKRRHSDLLEAAKGNKKKVARVSSVSDDLLRSPAKKPFSFSESPRPSSSPTVKRRKFQVQPREAFTARQRHNLDMFLNLEPDSHSLLSSLAAVKAEASVASDPRLGRSSRLEPSLSSTQHPANTSSSSSPPLSSPLAVKVEQQPSSDPSFRLPQVLLPPSSEPANPIRFPAAKSSEAASCKWEGCGAELDSTGKLLDHLRQTHASTQNPGRDIEDFTYKCLWRGCKVFGRGSSSRSWLDKHVATHGGNKPFACIVDGCQMRFGTQSLLERHVNAHFRKKDGAAAAGAPAAAEGEGGGDDDAPARGHMPSSSAAKVIRKAGKKMKLRKTIFSARIFDLFDVGIMAQVQEKLVGLCRAGRRELGLGPGADGGSALAVEVTGSVLARRLAVDAETGEEEAMALVTWKPDNILSDEWIPLSPSASAPPPRTVRLASLPCRARAELVSERLLGEPPRLLRPRKRRHPESSLRALS